MHIPQKRSNPGDDAKELGWCAYEPLESADMQDISERPQKNGRSSQVLFFYSLWHATKTWKWSCVHPHTSILSIQCSKCLNPRSFPSLFPGEGWRHRHGADARLHLAHLQALCRAALSLKTCPYDPQDHFKMAKWWNYHVKQMKIPQDDLQCSNDFNDFNDWWIKTVFLHDIVPLPSPSQASLGSHWRLAAKDVPMLWPAGGTDDGATQRTDGWKGWKGCLPIRFWCMSFLIFCVSKGKNLAPDWEKESEDLGFKFGVGPGVYHGHVFFSHNDYIHAFSSDEWLDAWFAGFLWNSRTSSGEACEWSTLRSSSTASTVIAVGTCSSWIVSIHARQKE